MTRLIALVAVLAVLFAPAPSASANALDPPVVYAHRGGASIAPENTLGAFRQAQALFGHRGVVLEMDAYVVKDGELVIIHDETLDRTTDCTGSVLDRTSDELQDCDAAVNWDDWGFEPVPRARDVLTEGRDAGWTILFELKNIPYEQSFDPLGSSFAEAFADLIADTEFPLDRIVVQAFWPPTLDRVKELIPGIGTALLTTSQLGFMAHHNAVYSTVRGYEVVAPDHNAPDLDAATVAAIQSLDREVVVWTVNAGDDIDRAISWGVDGIISDRPDRVYDALDNRLIISGTN